MPTDLSDRDNLHVRHFGIRTSPRKGISLCPSVPRRCPRFANLSPEYFSNKLEVPCFRAVHRFAAVLKILSMKDAQIFEKYRARADRTPFTASRSPLSVD